MNDMKKALLMTESTEPTYPFVSLSDNRRLTQEEIDSCVALTEELYQAACISGAPDEDTVNWIAPTGHKVFGHVSKVAFDSVDESFLNRLRLESHIFSGYRLSNLLGETNIAHWNDNIYDAFLSNSEIGEVDWSIPAFIEMTRGLSGKEICSPPAVMGEVGFRVGDHIVNRDVIAYQERMNLMNETGILSHLKRKEHPVILEIGCGYGALAYFLKQLLPEAVYILVDLPHSLIFSGCYLNVSLTNETPVVRKNASDPLLAPSVNLVVNKLLHTLEDVKIDLAINTLSFAEMSSDIVRHYGLFVKKHLQADGILFEQNFDNAHLGNAHFSDPLRILSEIFPLVGTPRSRQLWGNARIWMVS